MDKSVAKNTISAATLAVSTPILRPVEYAGKRLSLWLTVTGGSVRIEIDGNDATATTGEVIRESDGSVVLMPEEDVTPEAILLSGSPSLFYRWVDNV
jgi:hypothetical protein